MKAVLSGMAIALFVSILASFALNSAQRTSFEAYSTGSARVGDPGHNLVGPHWTGDNNEVTAETGT